MSKNRLSSLYSSSVDDSTNSEEEFLAFKCQLLKVQSFIEECNEKIVNKTLSSNDLTIMHTEMSYMIELEKKVTSKKMKTNYIPYKSLSLKMVQESYRICDWLVQKQCDDMDNVFSIESFLEKIFDECTDKEDPLVHLNTLFKGVIKNSDYFNLNFYGNIKSQDGELKTELTQTKREYKRSQKQPLEDLVVPDEVENTEADNELQITLLRVKSCLKKAVAKNNGKPISFHKFAIDPFSLTCTVENLFHLASLAKDGHVKIENASGGGDEFTTITVKKKKEDVTDNRNNRTSTLFTISNDIWKYYIKKYNIIERLIEQD